MSEVESVAQLHPYSLEELTEVTILLPETVIQWLNALTDVEREQHHETGCSREAVASTMVVAAMDHFITLAEYGIDPDAHMVARGGSRPLHTTLVSNFLKVVQ